MPEKQLSPEMWETIRQLDDCARKIIGCSNAEYVSEFSSHLHAFIQAQRKRWEEKHAKPLMLEEDKYKKIF